MLNNNRSISLRYGKAAFCWCGPCVPFPSRAPLTFCPHDPVEYLQEGGHALTTKFACFVPPAVHAAESCSFHSHHPLSLSPPPLLLSSLCPLAPRPLYTLIMYIMYSLTLHEVHISRHYTTLW